MSLLLSWVSVVNTKGLLLTQRSRKIGIGLILGSIWNDFKISPHNFYFFQSERLKIFNHWPDYLTKNPFVYIGALSRCGCGRHDMIWAQSISCCRHRAGCDCFGKPRISEHLVLPFKVVHKWNQRQAKAGPREEAGRVIGWGAMASWHLKLVIEFTVISCWWCDTGWWQVGQRQFFFLYVPPPIQSFGMGMSHWMFITQNCRNWKKLH